MQISLVDGIGFVIVYQSIFFALLLGWNSKFKSKFSLVLSVICLVIALHFIYIFIEKHGLERPFYLGAVFGLLYGPLQALFTASLTAKKFQSIDVIRHFALIPFVGLLWWLYPEWVVTNITWIALFVGVHFISYMLWSLYHLIKFRQRLKTYTASLQGIDLRWLQIAMILLLVVLLIALTQSLVSSPDLSLVLIAVIYVLILILLNVYYYLGWNHIRTLQGLPEPSQLNPTQSFRLSEKHHNELLEKLKLYMKDKEPHLEFQLSLQQLAEALDVSPRNLSHVINRAYGTNFYEFINSFRLQKASGLLVNSNLAIKVIMYDSGFSNKATFNAIFKKGKGMTPTQYREKHQ